MSTQTKKGDLGDIANLMASDGDSDNLMTEINNFINNGPLETPAGDGSTCSLDQMMNVRIKTEDGSGFISVSSLTKTPAKPTTNKKGPVKKKKLTKSAKAKPSSKNTSSPTEGHTLLSVFSVKQEPPSSDDEFSELEKSICSSKVTTESESGSSSKPQELDYLEPSTSSGGYTCKSIVGKPVSAIKVTHGFKLNATPVVLLEKLDLSRMSLKLASSNEGTSSKKTDLSLETPSKKFELSSQMSSLKSDASSETSNKQMDISSEISSLPVSKPQKKPLVKRSTSISKNEPIVQESSPATSKVDKLKADAASKVLAAKPFLSLGHHLSELGISTGTYKYELSLSPIVLANLSSEPFRKFMNLALDCAVHFRKNQNQPLSGNICLYFGDFVTLQSALQRLCQLPVNFHNMRLNGSIKCFDLRKLKNNPHDEAAKKSLTGRLMFQFCAHRIEKLQQLASVKECDTYKVLCYSSVTAVTCWSCCRAVEICIALVLEIKISVTAFFFQPYCIEGFAFWTFSLARAASSAYSRELIGRCANSDYSIQVVMVLNDVHKTGHEYDCCCLTTEEATPKYPMNSRAGSCLCDTVKSELFYIGLCTCCLGRSCSHPHKEAEQDLHTQAFGSTLFADRKKESTKVTSALINRVPVTLAKEMLLLLFPFSIDVRFSEEKRDRHLKRQGLKGPVSIEFESQEWMEAVLDCIREQSVKMSNLSSTELSTFRLYVKNYTPPKIPIGPIPAAPKSSIPSLMSTPVMPAIKGQGASRGRNASSGSSDRDQKVFSGGRYDGRNRDGEKSSGRSEQRSHSELDRKRPHEDRRLNRHSSIEKRGRFDGHNSSK
ncbi:hypothetical protein ElyMa_001413100 [Elysia marginata]|uniref:Uncharacterized protein n=1 Tax=Elysia marginata TaxID=1093978 RepID=A0AAV4IU91_9GAST|nr:hypothetical protein ElyMa_001413100 [Elysia marginata]